MNRIIRCLSALFFAISSAETMPPQAPARSQSLASLARLATAQDQRVAAEAIAALRSAGYPGLRALLDSGGAASPRICRNADASSPADHWDRWCAAVDAVAAQRDASVSGLYWHTDLAKAKEAARLSGKPILSLRLLGRLDEEFSCANSRFFRVALYANREIAQLLRDRFVLHWKSERPVPRITIDFGDGRRLERTITGNSVHYLLDADGHPLDALPGLYGPAAFRGWLLEAEKLAGVLARSQVPLPEMLASYHAEKLAEASALRETDRMSVDISMPKLAFSFRPSGGVVSASTAMPLTASKAAVETRLLDAFSPLKADLRTLNDNARWERLARLHAGEARLDATSRALFARENSSAPHAAEAIAKFEASTALDSVRNEYLFHSQIHQWFVGSQNTEELEGLNKKVYAELFLTPGTDPWLGLVPPDTYTALSDGGLRSSSRLLSPK